MPLKAMLVDDEELALRRLEKLLQPHAGQVQLLGSFDDSAAAVEQINARKPDLVFLDIQMPGLTGFQVLERLEHLPWVLFCTAYDSYALRAFEANAVDYLLKPVSPKRLQKALDKIGQLVGGQRDDFEQRLQQMLRQLQKPPAPKRLPLRSGDRVRLVAPEQILFLLAADKYVQVHTAEGRFLTDQSLNQLEKELDNPDFVRLHRSALANINHVEEFTRKLGGNYRARMKDQERTELPVSRAAKSRLGL